MAEPQRDTFTGPQPTGHYGPGYGEAGAPKGSAIEKPPGSTANEPAPGEPLAQVEAPQPPQAPEDDDEAAATPPSPS